METVFSDSFSEGVKGSRHGLDTLRLFHPQKHQAVGSLVLNCILSVISGHGNASDHQKNKHFIHAILED